jgi:glycerol uptake facilitator-like aquaporin
MLKQQHIAALIVEALGTFVLVMVVLNVSRYGLPFFTAIAAGLTVAAFVSAGAKISGGHFNPAVTLGFLSIRKVSFVRSIAYIIVQIAGAVAAWQLYEYFVDKALKNTSTPFDMHIVVAEAVGALVFGFAIAAVVSQKAEGWQAAATIGTGLFLGLTVAGLGSNAILNPAVAIGIRSFDTNYFLGPVVGVAVGMLVYTYAVHPFFSSATKTVAVKSPAPVSASVAPKAKKAPAKKKSAKKAKK